MEAVEVAEDLVARGRGEGGDQCDGDVERARAQEARTAVPQDRAEEADDEAGAAGDGAPPVVDGDDGVDGARDQAWHEVEVTAVRGEDRAGASGDPSPEEEPPVLGVERVPRGGTHSQRRDRRGQDSDRDG